MRGLMPMGMGTSQCEFGLRKKWINRYYKLPTQGDTKIPRTIKPWLPEISGIVRICGVELRFEAGVAVLKHEGHATESPFLRIQAYLRRVRTGKKRAVCERRHPCRTRGHCCAWLAGCESSQLSCRQVTEVRSETFRWRQAPARGIPSRLQS